MKKFKLLLIIFLLPITFIIYYVTSEEYGISAYVAKQKILDKIYIDNQSTLNEIHYLTMKINLLKANNPDLDLLNEKALDILGVSDKGTIVINVEDL